MNKKLLSLIAAFAMLLSLCACQGGQAAASESAASPAPSGSASPSPYETPAIEADLTKSLFEFASGLPDGDTAMTVNGREIPNELYLYWLSANCYQVYSQYQQYAAMGLAMQADFSDPELAGNVRDNTKAAVTYYSVLRDLCEENGVSMTAEDEADLQSLIDETLSAQGLTMEQLLQSCGLSEESFRYLYSSSYLFENLSEKLMGEPTGADLEKYVEDNGIFACKHILIKTVSEDQKDGDGNVTQTMDEYNAEKKSLADKLLSQIQAAGEGKEELLDELAEEHSEDGRNEDGTLTSPDGYVFDATSSLVDGFREGTLALQVGEVGLVETDYGYHIIMRLPVDASEYEDDWRKNGTDAALTAAAEEAQVILSEEIQAVDLPDFFNRYVAYLAALYDELNPAPSESPSAEPSQSPDPSESASQQAG